MSLKKVINIGGIDVEFKASAAVLYMYRIKFNRDMIKDIQHAYSGDIDDVDNISIEDLEVFEKVAYIMARHADPTITDDVEEWLSQFGMFAIYNALPEIINLWGVSASGIEKSKKK